MFHLRFIAGNHAFFKHNLHQLQGRAVLYFTFGAIQFIVHQPNGGRTMFPQYLQNFELGPGRLRRSIFFTGRLHGLKVGNFSYDEFFSRDFFPGQFQGSAADPSVDIIYFSMSYHPSMQTDHLADTDTQHALPSVISAVRPCK